VNKRDIVREISLQSKLPLGEVKEVLNSFLKCLEKALSKGERVEIRGLGVFYIKERGASRRINPKTGKENLVQEGKRVAFKISRKFKGIVKE